MREVPPDEGWAGQSIKSLLYLIGVSVLITVSLYGDGYVSMPLQEAKMSTNIRVKFRTKQEDAFLFLAAGRTDYCLLRLENGIISFSYKIEQNVVQVSRRCLINFNLDFNFNFQLAAAFAQEAKAQRLGVARCGRATFREQCHLAGG